MNIEERRERRSQRNQVQQFQHFENLFRLPWLSTHRRERRESKSFIKPIKKAAKDTRARNYQQAAAFKQADAQLKALIETVPALSHYPIQARIKSSLYSQVLKAHPPLDHFEHFTR